MKEELPFDFAQGNTLRRKQSEVEVSPMGKNELDGAIPVSPIIIERW